MADGEYWRIRWRLVIDRSRNVEALTFDSTADLTAAIRRSKADIHITDRRWFRIRDWIGPVPTHTCGLRDVDWPEHQQYPCLCGEVHRTFQCTRCGIDETVPPLAEQCGMVPWEDMPEQWTGRGPTWTPPKGWERG